ncbi:HD domain-containing phosphohydrolase [Glycomyces arizonensis]|uniref:HD domain-containing phosphohydrolase n=1 Tax=Glycomyces arizonensis TaxID=256035 RepID=UPI000479C416|nr:HD domain-containing phosphohydrolase [Glycomyces arizonensis]
MNQRGGVRLAEVLGAMSLAVDLGLGQPMGHVARSCLLAQRLAALAGLPERDADLYHVALMGWVGCIADSYDAAARFGDDIDYRADVYDLDMRPLPFLGYLLRRVGPGESVPKRVGRAAALVATGAKSVQESLRAHCQVTEQIARRFGLPEAVCASLRQVFARWDGKGLPPKLGGTDISVTIRVWHIADVAEVHDARGGVRAAVKVIRDRRGTQFDPQLTDLFCAHADELMAALPEDVDETWTDLLAAEPATARELSDEELDAALEALADWVDLKSPYFTGHSRAVAELARQGARRCGLTEDDVRLVRRAGLVHDLGRIGVPNTIWDKTTALTPVEMERVRLHSYYTERMLTEPRAMAAIGRVAASAHERLDGSGYHRGRTAGDLPATARVLAAADCYRTSIEERPHRAAKDPAAAADRLRREAAEGRLDTTAVNAVLAAAGQRRSRSPMGPAGLTPREVEVIALLAKGHTNRQIARALSVAPKTVGNHVEHIYTKIGVGTRAAATLFAMEHGLV